MIWALAVGNERCGGMTLEGPCAHQFQPDEPIALHERVRRIQRCQDCARRMGCEPDVAAIDALRHRREASASAPVSYGTKRPEDGYRPLLAEREPGDETEQPKPPANSVGELAQNFRMPRPGTPKPYHSLPASTRKRDRSIAHHNH